MSIREALPILAAAAAFGLAYYGLLVAADRAAEWLRRNYWL